MSEGLMELTFEAPKPVRGMLKFLKMWEGRSYNNYITSLLTSCLDKVRDEDIAFTQMLWGRGLAKAIIRVKVPTSLYSLIAEKILQFDATRSQVITAVLLSDCARDLIMKETNRDLVSTTKMLIEKEVAKNE